MIALKNKKFLLGFCALLVAVALVSAGVTLALTTVEYPYTTNVVTIGEVRIELIDNYYDSDMTANGQTYTEDNPPVFAPNTDVQKTVKVKNVGKYPCYVRLQVRKDWVYQEGMTQANLDAYITWTTSAKWIEGEDLDDGYVYYYYTDILQPNAETTGLFASNQFHIGDYNKSYGSKSVGHIYVQAQAVQSDYTTGDFGSGKTFETDSDGHVVKWNGLLFN